MNISDIKLRLFVFALSLTAVISVSTGGYLYYKMAKKIALTESQKDARENLKDIGNYIDSYLSWSEATVKALSGLPDIKKVLIAKDKASFSEANKILNNFNININSSVCYVMDRSGKTIAASNSNKPGSFVGKNYSFRPYFKNAIQGIPSKFMALGVTSNKRGIYFSHPVYIEENPEPAGVVVIKSAIDSIEKKFKESFDGILLLTNFQGVIFISNTKRWLYHVLWDTAPETKQQIAESKQFGNGPWEWTGLKRINEQTASNKDANKYAVYKKKLSNYKGWELICLQNNQVVFEKIVKPLTRSVSVNVLSVCSIIILVILILFKRANGEIIQRKKAEDELKESYDKLDRRVKKRTREIEIINRDLLVKNWAIESSTTGMRISDRDGNPIFINDMYLKMWKFKSKEEAMKTPIENRYKDGKAAAEHFTSVLKTGSNIGEFDAIRNDGSTFPVRIVRSVVKGEKNEPLYVFSSFEDISEIKKTQAQLIQSEKLAGIGQLAGGIAHDFNNILSIILGNTELALDHVTNADHAHDKLKEIEIATHRAKDLVRQILDFSRKSTPDRKNISIVSIFNEALKLIRASLPSSVKIQKNIRVENEIIYANPTQINQIFLNLCTNAAQAMEYNGTLDISLRTKMIKDCENNTWGDIPPGKYIQLSVKDEGHGIEKEHRDRIFDPYFSTKKLGEGTGLGLSVVYGIVKSYEGTVIVNSEIEKGTTFHVYLPIAQTKTIPEKELQEPDHHGHEKILVVDDEEQLLILLKQLLESFGYHVECTNHPQNAIELFQAKPDFFDLVITDMAMPDIPGNELAPKLMEIRPDIPIILCTGYSEKIDKESAKKTGIKKYLLKPIRKQELAQAVRQVLSKNTPDN